MARCIYFPLIPFSFKYQIQVWWLLISFPSLFNRIIYMFIS